MQGAAGAIQNFGALQHALIDRDDVLQMAAAVNSIVHAYAIYHQQYPAGFKPANDGAAAALLAFLHEYVAGALQQVAGVLGVGAPNVLAGDDFNFLNDVLGFFGKLGTADEYIGQRGIAQWLECVLGWRLPEQRSGCNEANDNDNCFHVSFGFTMI